MASEALVDEEVDVLVRVLRDGSVQPTSFLWRDRTRYVGDHGRQWEERVEGRSLRCYLVQTVDGCATTPPPTAGPSTAPGCAI